MEPTIDYILTAALERCNMERNSHDFLALQLQLRLPKTTLETLASTDLSGAGANGNVDSLLNAIASLASKRDVTPTVFAAASRCLAARHGWQFIPIEEMFTTASLWTTAAKLMATTMDLVDGTPGILVCQMLEDHCRMELIAPLPTAEDFHAPPQRYKSLAKKSVPTKVVTGAVYPAMKYAQNDRLSEILRPNPFALCATAALVGRRAGDREALPQFSTTTLQHIKGDLVDLLLMPERSMETLSLTEAAKKSSRSDTLSNSANTPSHAHPRRPPMQVVISLLSEDEPRNNDDDDKPNIVTKSINTMDIAAKAESITLRHASDDGEVIEDDGDDGNMEYIGPTKGKSGDDTSYLRCNAIGCNRAHAKLRLILSHEHTDHGADWHRLGKFPCDTCKSGFATAAARYWHLCCLLEREPKVVNMQSDQITRQTEDTHADFGSDAGSHLDPVRLYSKNPRNMTPTFICTFQGCAQSFWQVHELDTHGELHPTILDLKNMLGLALLRKQDLDEMCLKWPEFADSIETLRMDYIENNMKDFLDLASKHQPSDISSLYPPRPATDTGPLIVFHRTSSPTQRFIMSSRLDVFFGIAARLPRPRLAGLGMTGMGDGGKPPEVNVNGITQRRILGPPCSHLHDFAVAQAHGMDYLLPRNRPITGMKHCPLAKRARRRSSSYNSLASTAAISTMPTRDKGLQETIFCHSMGSSMGSIAFTL
ncbi:hypothetical protein LTR17_012680 [Elasticomyces elasticus]|nr:hypothetical protein LTR17_012680 [Elasticomyces elasticus]